MATTNHERVGKALELLKDGLQPFVEREMKSQHKQQWLIAAKASVAETQKHLFNGSEPQWDSASLLATMWNQWDPVFKKTLGQPHRSLINELRDVRNQWAHQKPFSGDDAYRALDSTSRLLSAVSAPQAEEVEKIKMELLRVRFDEQVRSEKRRSAGTAIESQVTGSLKPWREVVTPHRDVASGRYQQAEFAADLWQVHMGEGSDEYLNPAEFYRRTYLTHSLNQLLVGAVQRLAGQGGDPVVQLQTNFGGGKTHSMLALYHLFSTAAPGELAGIDEVLREAGMSRPPKVNRVVLVGNKISPGNPVTKADGTIVRTLWGELAWQLGFNADGVKEAKKAFGRIQADDEKATSPGDVLRELFNDYGPCLVLIDEWVAYARQLHDQSDLPAGGFETQFTFAQVLTESAKLAKHSLLVISLPASDTSGSPHTQTDDVEVGGIRGREALDRLRNVVGRVESSWRPASAEEGFEIVRRRLFEPLIEQSRFVDRDLVAQAFANLYRSQHQEFPPETRDPDYEKRMKAAYPIHPEIFDRLYTEWSTLVKFQRTRGVLRLMAAVIHSLWEKGDKNPLILPANIPIDDPRVQFELTRYLSDNWVPIIEKDVDGPSSLPLRIDGDVPNLGKYAACRRVARTIYLGSAPTASAANRGIEDRQVKLGCVMPGESPNVFGDALRRLAASATYLYQDGPRYWYSTQPTVTKLADDRAEQLKRDPDKVAHELDKRLRLDLRKMGDFKRVHPLPGSSADVPDDLDARLVVLSADHPYTKEPNSPAEAAAKAIFETRGTTPRLFRNTLIFLAADKVRLQDLDESVRKFLAWESILKEAEQLNLSPHQRTQAETQRTAADGTVTARIPETYQWLLTPTQETPQSPVTWPASRLSGTDPLAERASKKLKSDESLIVNFAASRLRMEMDRVPLWRGNHVSVRQLIEDFGRDLYLPRLQSPSVLVNAIRSGLALLTWEKDAFAYGESYDDSVPRYRGLHYGMQCAIAEEDAGLLVRPEVARKQIDDETAPAVPTQSEQTAPSSPSKPDPGWANATGPAQPPKPKRFHGTVTLDSARVGRDASKIADEVITHLVGLVGSNVKITLDIEAEVPAGVPDSVVRTVTENSRTLKFATNSGFETE
jgi:predicted AAA+ superfamily ATPase